MNSGDESLQRALMITKILAERWQTIFRRTSRVLVMNWSQSLAGFGKKSLNWERAYQVWQSRAPDFSFAQGCWRFSRRTARIKRLMQSLDRSSIGRSSPYANSCLGLRGRPFLKRGRGGEIFMLGLPLNERTDEPPYPSTSLAWAQVLEKKFP